jgi:predicted DNA-binding transcriptional regulator AlpA
MNREPPSPLPIATADALLVRAEGAARICAMSLRSWRSWDAAGLVPSPIRIKRSTFWRKAELEAWVAAGCPRRAEWEAHKKAGIALSQPRS